MDRQQKLNWMKDILDHLRICYEQWSMSDSQSEYYLTELMRRDVDEFRRLCDSLAATKGHCRAMHAA